MKSEDMLRFIGTIRAMRVTLRNLQLRHENHNEMIVQLSKQPLRFFHILRKLQIKRHDIVLKNIISQEKSLKTLVLLQELLFSAVKDGKVSDGAVVSCCMEILFALIYVNISSVHTKKQKHVIKEMGDNVFFIAQEYSKDHANVA